MSTHPSDIEIQDYALQPSGAVHAHLEHCPQCMERVRRYRSLFIALNRRAIPEPEFHVAGAVMARLPHRSSKPENVLNLAVTGVAIVIAIGAPFLPNMPGYSWLARLEKTTVTILTLGGAALTIFLLAMQLQYFRKVLRIIKSSKEMQPEH